MSDIEIAPDEDPSSGVVDEVTTLVVAAGMSERKLARRENWRLIRRRPSFIIGMIIVTVWVICALFPETLAPFHPLDFRTNLNQAPSWPRSWSITAP